MCICNHARCACPTLTSTTYARVSNMPMTSAATWPLPLFFEPPEPPALRIVRRLTRNERRLQAKARATGRAALSSGQPRSHEARRAMHVRATSLKREAA